MISGQMSLTIYTVQLHTFLPYYRHVFFERKTQFYKSLVIEFGVQLLLTLWSRAILGELIVQMPLTSLLETLKMAFVLCSRVCFPSCHSVTLDNASYLNAQRTETSKDSHSI